ncbi:DUF7249 family protein [Collinsella aerofaciens]|uniref:DUF7249 family protein n=1 Tax=Collinsella aerofaciens TaxID=74426 RepID=UPI001D0165CF|nr:hypothetical protein [Collinsella aerofaciens]MCB5366960.1 hypothetical protein [Collinsella aerofaciens]MCB5368999.1 hypothetical protein [Collinsella aerofaciens]
MEKYNGWTNRETWLVNLYFGEGFYDYIVERLEEGGLEQFNRDDQDAILEIAGIYRGYVEDYLEEELEKLSSFLSDYINLGLIDWYDLAENVYNDLKE